jgi:hypothetical protein
MAISSTALTGSSITIFNPNDSYQYAVTTMFFCNTTGGDLTLTSVNLVPSGGSASTTNQVINSLVIPAGDTFTFETEKIILGAGDKVYANGASGISATVCSLQVG